MPGNGLKWLNRKRGCNALLQPPVYYFSMVMNSTPNIFVAGFLLTTSICRFLILFVFHKKPNQRLYCTVSAINRLSRFICVPVNTPAGVVHPCNSKYGSTISIQRNTVVTVSPGKYTILSRTSPLIRLSFPFAPS